MTLSRVRLGSSDGELAAALAAIRVDLDVTAVFPPEVEAEAAAAVASVALPDVGMPAVPFFTIDPADSLDLDQAMHLERSGDGYRVRYAIADVPAFVKPGGAIDAEARKRGQTLYPPDGRIPLHPLIISESAASLLPGQIRGAFVWTFELDADARQTAVTLERARVRSTARYDYEEVQSLIDSGSATEGVALLKEIGVKLVALEHERHGASLGRPDQEIREVDGRYELVRRRPLEAEGWNAQISLLTGMAAATIMLDGGVGILRTMPEPNRDSIDWFRRRAAALGTPWPESIAYGDYLRSLDPDDPKQLAIMHAAASLFRGAGYTAFDTSVPGAAIPADIIQSAVGAPYAHATAPLRR
ncbi:MAG: RNB domain-containing ribonuclease, partial [Cryobacterium sp.]|nr:RNB domain-containing ribonuclease [Cryobacterium sp.]